MPKTDRRTELTVAVIALIGVLLSGAVAAGATYWTAHMTNESQQQQSLEQYRRDKRNAVYVNLLTQLTSLEATLRQIGIDHIKQGMSNAAPPAPDQPPSLPEDMTKQEDDKWQAAYSKSNDAISAAELVSSQAMIELSKALRDVYANSYYRLAYPNLLSQAGVSIANSLGLAPVSPRTGGSPPPTVLPTEPAPAPGAPPAPAAPPPSVVSVPPIEKVPPLPYNPSLLQLPTWQLRDMFVQEAKKEIDLND